MSSLDQPPGGVPLRVRLLGGFEIEGLDERALGTRKGRTLLRGVAAELAREAGFTGFRRVPLDNPFNNLYEATP